MAEAAKLSEDRLREWKEIGFSKREAQAFNKKVLSLKAGEDYVVLFCDWKAMNDDVRKLISDLTLLGLHIQKANTEQDDYFVVVSKKTLPNGFAQALWYSSCAGHSYDGYKPAKLISLR